MPAPAATPADATLEARVVAARCVNLGVTIQLRGAQIARAQALLPAGFELRRRPTLLVETSWCGAVSIDGRAVGAAGLSEAALSIRRPRAHAINEPHERWAEHLFMLSQLDTNAELSALKARVGYRTEVTSIALRLGRRGLPRLQATASAAGTLTPAAASARLSPALLPGFVRVPNPGVVFQLWTQDSAGCAVVTTNTNEGIGRPALGWGRVTVAEGTALHGLLGTTSAAGVAFSGSARRFVNATYRFDR